MPKFPQLPRVVFGGPDPNYWRALGQFIEAFSTCEAVVFDVLAFHAGVSIPIAKAVFSGIRMDAAINLINRIVTEVHAVAPERGADLAKLFSQLRSIMDVRNKIIHYGTFVTIDKGRVASTARLALTPEKVQEHRASVEVLEAMTADIIRIYNALLWDLNRNRPSPSDPSLRDPWQYKPESPTAHRKGKSSDRRS